ncbi:hypothetical protein CAPTEDRAFT_172907 [Capitella teleta]|uniref:Cytochrome c oxidase assembly factor 6 n=1 Tax=Capitella teleta TaxID=283909 RepID=R7VGF5_CAPTE|nr:hypothetical protein CAPTEDRAFT_172907 [Capitella teleta]|eukprot:ELU17933.1 hypothetical protein CAPTEDRAFT_172907 [Capitella teleta]
MATTAKYLNKTERAACWKHRDSYFDCLTLNNEDANKCVKQFKDYEDSCPKAWVIHFLRKRSFDKMKEQMDKGFDPIDSKTKA